MEASYSNLSRDELLKLLKIKDAEVEALKSAKKADDQACNIKTIKEVKDYVTEDIKYDKLSNKDISRYSRQLILPELGPKSQLKLKNSSVLIVGAGGLGCPASVYLAAAGIGKIGVVDYDEVELSNLHRQISHSEDRIGVSKSLSIALSCQSLNSSVECVPYEFQLNSSNALDLIKRYDIILDATDNVATRYLLNDACVLAGKPLVSGSALRFEGQLTVYHCDGGPCYRCLFPKPPPADTVTNCSDGGVLGVVPGIIGSLQALEAIKIAAGIGTSYSQRLLLMDALDGTFRQVKLRPRSTDCAVCGAQPSVLGLIDYEQFCGGRATDKDQALHVLTDSSRISPEEYASMLTNETPHLLVDVRTEVETEICQLPNKAINIPLSTMKRKPLDAVVAIGKALAAMAGAKKSEHIPVVCVCRRGNDSQMAIDILQKQTFPAEFAPPKRLLDIRGGLHGWAHKVDPEFPVY